MTRDDITLSRRKILAGIGATGIASVGAGVGTSAYFSDRESFGGNTLAAGELDLKVDWEEHYAYPQTYGFPDPTEVLDHDILYESPEGDDGYVGFPDPENPHVWIHEDDIPAYMAATSIEAFPDPDDDGQQGSAENDFEYVPCDDGADLPIHLDPRAEGALRTDNADTWDEEAETYRPLVSLDDVKPGDFGELTLSFHLCNNPGYVWLQASNVSESENGMTEPEMAVDDDDSPDLAENIQTVWWYDALGDNVVQTNCEETLYLIENVGSGTAGDGQTPDPDDRPYIFEVELSDGVATLTDVTAVEVDGISAGHIAAASNGDTIYIVDRDSGTLGAYDIEDDSFTSLGTIANHPGGVVLVSFSPGGTLYMASNDTDSLYVVEDLDSAPTATLVGDTGIDVQGADIAFTADGTLYLYSNGEGSGTLYTLSTLDGTATEVGETGMQLTGLAVRDAGTGDLVGSATDPDDEVIVIDKTDGSIVDEFTMERDGEPYDYDFGDMTVGQICGEVFHRGTLKEDLAALESSPVPLDGNLATSFDEFSGSPDSPDRECFQPGLTYYIGFAWWLPRDVGNEAQTDSVSFDLGFYTEQCRHNDGSGSMGIPE
ncbi:SipW-dependent-type signal peptide-containing protein [Haloarchaeobius baliensis]|uniref:YncE family protein n=1 Tax=Haloarchaeobius baliensis TaxID=1670458 RepID=UPI003F88144E